MIVSPSNGESGLPSTVTLQWSVQNWGETCGTPSQNTFDVTYWQQGETMPPPQVRLTVWSCNNAHVVSKFGGQLTRYWTPCQWCLELESGSKEWSKGNCANFDSD